MNGDATVPNPNDDDVVELLKLNGLTGQPQYIRYEDRGYDPQWCHVSAKHCAVIDGGKRVHGWALWRFEDPTAPGGQTIAVAEHHSVWESQDGELVDVTPPRFGRASVLFVRDDTATIEFRDNSFLMRTELTNWPEVPRMLFGIPTSSAVYPLVPSERPDVIAYAARLGFDIALLATDESHG